MATDSPIPDISHDTSLIDTLLRYVIPQTKARSPKRQDSEEESELERSIRKEQSKDSHKEKQGNTGKDQSPLKLLTDSIDDILSRQEGLEIAKEESPASVSYHTQRKTTPKNYTVTIDYKSDGEEEELSIRFEPVDEKYKIPGAQSIDKPISLSFRRSLPADERTGYSTAITYRQEADKETLDMTYSVENQYLADHLKSKHDTSNNVQLKNLNIFPETIMGGVLGFTYLGENFMGRRDDLQGSMARMVDIHESIHTHDEYETRVLTDWIMAGSEVPKYTPLHFAMPANRYVK